MLRTYLTVVGWRTLSLVFAALFVALVPAVISPAEYGRFNLVLSITQVGAGLMLSWPNQALLRFGREQFLAEGVVGTAAATRALLHVLLLAPTLTLAAVLAEPLARWADVAPNLLMGALFVGLPLISTLDALTYIAQASGRFSGFGLVPLVLRACQLAALPLMALSVGATWGGLIAATLIGNALGCVVTLASLPAGTMARFRPSARMLRQFVAYARFQPLTSVSAFLLTWMDLWFLRALGDSDKVGIYAWAYTITLMATTLLVPLSAILGPRAIDGRLDGNLQTGQATLYAVRTGCAVLSVAVTAAVGIVPLVAALLPLGTYAAAVTPVVFLAAGTMFQLGMAAVEPTVYAHEDLVPRMAVVTLLMVGTNAAADWLLIPILGLAGPALGTAAAYGIGMAMVWRMLGRRLNGGPSPWPCLALGAAALVVAAAVIILPPAAGVPTGLCAAAAMTLAARRAGLFAGLLALKRHSPSWAGRTISWLARGE